MALLAIMGKGRDKVGIPCESFFWVSTCQCGFLHSPGFVQVGLFWADGPCDGLGVAWQGNMWAPLHALVSLESFVGLWPFVPMSFVTQPSRCNLVFS